MLIRIVKFEIKRAFRSTGTLISILIGSLIVILDALFFYLEYGHTDSTTLIQAWIGTDYQFAYGELYYTILPILACLPYAGSYFQDIKAGYHKNICTRVSKKAYVFAKGIAIYLTSFTCVTIPLFLSLFINAGIYPNWSPERLTFLYPGVLDCYRFPVIFETHPLLYMIIFILIDGLYAGVYGLLSLAITRVSRSQFTVVVSPFILLTLNNLVSVDFDSAKVLSVSEMIKPIQVFLFTTTEMNLTYLIMLASCLLVIWLVERKRDCL